MPKTIWKFPLEITDVQTIDVPEGSKFLAVQVQRDVPCLWVLVDPTAPKERFEIHTVGTGNPAPDGLEYLGTYQVVALNLVFHVFVD
jgi:hypothetical protein